MAGSALRRLMAEYKRKSKVHTKHFTHSHTKNQSSPELTLDPPEGIVAGPISEDNFFEWEALIA